MLERSGRCQGRCPRLPGSRIRREQMKQEVVKVVLENTPPNVDENEPNFLWLGGGREGRVQQACKRSLLAPGPHKRIEIDCMCLKLKTINTLYVRATITEPVFAGVSVPKRSCNRDAVMRRNTRRNTIARRIDTASTARSWWGKASIACSGWR